MADDYNSGWGETTSDDGPALMESCAGPSPGLFLLALMDYDRAFADGLLRSVIVYIVFQAAYFIPDADAERIRLAVPGPYLELV